MSKIKAHFHDLLDKDREFMDMVTISAPEILHDVDELEADITALIERSKYYDERPTQETLERLRDSVRYLLRKFRWH